VKKLQLEPDYDLAPPQVTLRFYEVENGSKRQLHIQDLYNLSKQIHAGRDADQWEAWTDRVLKSIWRSINKPHLIRKNPPVLKVTTERFDSWRQNWKDISEAIVDHETQAEYTSEETNAKVTVEIHKHGTKSTLACYVIAPDGARAPYHTCGERLVGECSEVTVADKRYELDLPFDRDVLNRIFGKANPEVSTTALADHLPTILNHRLDLLSGPSVATATRRGTPRLQIRGEGEQLIIEATIDKAPIFTDSAIPPMRLAAGRDNFTVVTTESPVLEDVRIFLRAVTDDPADGAVYRIPATTEFIQRLRDAHGALPSDVIVRADRHIEELFEETIVIRPMLIMEEGRGWFDVEVKGAVGDEQIEADEIRAFLEDGQKTVRTRSGVLLSFDETSGDLLRSFLEKSGLEPGQQRVTSDHGGTIASSAKEIADMRMQRSTRALVEALSDRPTVRDMPMPEHLTDVLRDYQVTGANFLYNRTSYDLGCLLADDMGLGKTLQILTYLQIRKIEDPAANALVVCPASVVSVWTQEIARFAGELRVRELVGDAERRRRTLTEAGGADVFITSFAIVRNDIALLRTREFDTLIIDEAQNIRNPDAEITFCIKTLQSNRRIAATGTPLENRPLDLWSIVDFLNPGYLGTREAFNANPDPVRLRQRIEPIMLRRTKTEVAPELPPRTEETILLSLNEYQHALYQRELQVARERVKAGGVMEILAAITRLRQLCCHPTLIPERAEATSTKIPDIAESVKLIWLMDTLPDLLAAGHSVLVFSTFTSMLAIIESHLADQNIPHFSLTGDTPVTARGKIVNEFVESPDASVFLLSLKAAGTGLNLTRADYVFIFDPWWNPAAERQAIDRTHRIGQEQPVIAYRFACRGTVEEKVLALQAEKQELFTSIIDGAASTPDLDRDELLALLR
jgi:superfamily II DNA or RNA helicase